MCSFFAIIKRFCIIQTSKARIHPKFFLTSNTLCTKVAHFYDFCGLQKLNTFNIHLFLYLQNLRNHFSTVLIETN